MYKNVSNFSFLYMKSLRKDFASFLKIHHFFGAFVSEIHGAKLRPVVKIKAYAPLRGPLDPSSKESVESDPWRPPTGVREEFLIYMAPASLWENKGGRGVCVSTLLSDSPPSGKNRAPSRAKLGMVLKQYCTGGGL